MEEKYFMHRIQEISGEMQKGIEVHDTLNSAILAFWGRIKTGYNNPQNPDTDFVSCKITDINGNTVGMYDLTWSRAPFETSSFFLHYIRKDGENFTKGIDTYSSFDSAISAFAAMMEYGYDNPRHTNVSLVACEITDRTGMVLKPFSACWIRPEAEE